MGREILRKETKVEKKFLSAPLRESVEENPKLETHRNVNNHLSDHQRITTVSESDSDENFRVPKQKSPPVAQTYDIDDIIGPDNISFDTDTDDYDYDEEFLSRNKVD
jgi:hypothetical protein